MTNAFICLNLSQAEQVNGFYLVSCSLHSEPNTPLKLEDLIAKTFSFEQAPEVELCLFQIPQNSGAKALFLSNQALPETVLTAPSAVLQVVQSCAVSDLPAKVQKQEPFKLPDQQQPLLILAEQPYLANAFALAKLRQINKAENTVVLMQSQAFPFRLKPARFWAPEMPDEAIGASELLEDWGIMNRQASKELVPGSYQGELIELFNYWLKHQQDLNAWQLSLFCKAEKSPAYLALFEQFKR